MTYPHGKIVYSKGGNTWEASVRVAKDLIVHRYGNTKAQATENLVSALVAKLQEA